MKIKKTAALAAVAAVAVAGAALITPAFGEPVSNSYVLVGSDTLQDSANALINGTLATGSSVRVVSEGTTLGSFDAFGSDAIQTRPGGIFWSRPSGSGQGVAALRASIRGRTEPALTYKSNVNNTTPARNIKDQVDIARSSSAPTQDANGLLLYVPYARDAVGYAYKGGNSSWANLSATQLKQIYDAAPGSVSIGGVPVTPRLPQSGSGTRDFFLKAIGSTGGTVGADTTNTTKENDASVLKDNEIIPFSVANWIAQANQVTGINTTGSAGVQFGSPVAGQVPFTGTAPSLVPSSGYYSDTTFGRDTYLVVERARVQDPAASTYDARLAALVDPSRADSLTNFGTFRSTPGAVKTKFGFLAPSSSAPIPAVPTL